MSNFSEEIFIKKTIELSKDIAELYLNKDFSDVVFKLDEETYHAHKTILGARCKYFEKLLFSEGKATDQDTIEVSYTSHEAFLALLKYIYTGVITLESTNINIILDLISVSNQYEMLDLMSTISKKLAVFISKTNVGSILKIARLFDLEDLINACVSFMKSHGIEIPVQELPVEPEAEL